jgi:methylmalonyl-CoA/ethylmalonyl-CoA epimerase
MVERLKANFIDHISIAVKDVRKAEEDFKNTFGWEVAGRYKDFDEKIRVVYFKVGPTALEIMEDLDGTGDVAKFIERKGEGIMVLSFNVDNCSESLELLKRNDIKVIDEMPRMAKELKRKFAFIHPKVCHGILTEVIDGEY